MDFEQIQNAVLLATESLKSESRPLRLANVHERSIAHRIAVHMEPLFIEWDIDCEYDRDGEVRKELDGIAGCDAQKRTNVILPDIVVHKRGHRNRENNLLVIEIKKNEIKDICDAEKLKLFTSGSNRYQYQFGLYIFINSGEFVFTWYKDGQAFQSSV